MGEITISAAVAWLLAVAAGLVTITKAWELIRRWLHPEADLRPTVTRHNELLDNDRKHLDRHDVEMEDLHKGISVICQTQLALLNHEISGNDIERLKVAREKLNQYLVNR